MKLFAVMIVIAVAIVGVYFLRGWQRNVFEFDYVIIDSAGSASASESGAMSSITYYQISFENRQVRKLQNDRRLPGVDYENVQVIYQTDFDERTGEKLKLLLEKLWQSGGEVPDGISDYYAVSKDGDMKLVRNNSEISQLKAYTDKFNKLGSTATTSGV